MNTYRWLPRSVILLNERFKLWALRAAVEKARGTEHEGKATDLLQRQEQEVERWSRR